MTETEYKEVYQGPKKIRIPESWSIERFDSDLFTEKIQAGGTPKATNDDFYGGDIPFVKIEDMTAAGKFIHDTSNTLTEEGFEDATAWKVPKKSLLLSMYGSYGKVAITERELTTNQAILGIIPSDETDLEYIYYAAQRMRPYYEAMVRETTQANLTKGIVTKTPLVRPPLPEQRRIAEILSTVDEAIQQTDEIIETSKELKKGLMQDLMFKGIDNEDFKEVRIGPSKYEVPEDWNLEVLDDLNTDEKPICYGVLQTEEEDDSGVPIVKIEDLRGNMDNPGDLFKISKEKHEEYSRSTITGGEVLVSVIGRIGLVDVVPEVEQEMNITRNVARITPEKADPVWLSYYLKSKPVQDMLSVISSTTTRSSLNIGDLRKLEVFVPPLDEQREIAERLSVVDEKIRQEEEYREKLEELKKSLMQDLLTGKKRVDV